MVLGIRVKWGEEEEGAGTASARGWQVDARAALTPIRSALASYRGLSSGQLSGKYPVRFNISIKFMNV